MGTTEDEMKNLGLFELGVENITDFSATTPLVTKVNQIYSLSYQSMLSLYRWGFAVKSIEITGVALTDERYAYEFTLPAGYLRTENVFTEVTERDIVLDYKVENDVIKCNQDTIYLRYISEAAITTAPAYFVDCFKYKLAHDLCFNLTGDVEKKKDLNQDFLFYYVNAKNLDFRQYPTKIIKSRPYVNIRN